MGQLRVLALFQVFKRERLILVDLFEQVIKLFDLLSSLWNHLVSELFIHIYRNTSQYYLISGVTLSFVAIDSFMLLNNLH